jgi:separase
LLETIHKKFPDPETFDDIGWSAITPDGVPLPRRKLKSSRGFARLNFVRSWDAHLDEDTPDEGETSLMQYWDALRAKYNATEYTLTHLSRSPVTSLLPPHWTVVNITVTEDHSTMFISRQCASKEPLIFCVPIKDRRECADDDGGPHLTFGEALLELEEIVKLSDVGTRQAVNVRNDDAEAKAEWWKGRKQLDRRMKVLLENIEFCWLGAFKVSI